MVLLTRVPSSLPMRTFEEAQERIWQTAQYLLVEDLLRLHHGAPPGGVRIPVGQETGYKSRGMIFTFFSNVADLKTYAPARVGVTGPDGAYLDLFAEDFPLLLSSHLDRNKERSRIVMRGKDGEYRLFADASLREFLWPSIDRLTSLLGAEPYELDEAQAAFLGDAEAAKVISLPTIYAALLSTTYTGKEATRSESALLTALAARTSIITMRQLVERQEGYDVPVPVQSPLTGEVRQEMRSRIGLGRILQYGPSGLERDALLRIAPGSDPAFHLKVLRDDDGAAFPIVLVETSHRFDPVRRRVSPIDGSSLVPVERFLPYGLSLPIGQP